MENSKEITEAMVKIDLAQVKMNQVLISLRVANDEMNLARMELKAVLCHTEELYERALGDGKAAKEALIIESLVLMEADDAETG